MLLKRYFIFIFRYTSRGTPQVSQTAAKKAPPGAVFVETKKAAKKQPTKPVEENQVTKMMSEIKISSSITPEQIESEEKEKRLRKLRKTLREIEALEVKMKAGPNGFGVQLEKPQADKVARKQEILDEIETLN